MPEVIYFRHPAFWKQALELLHFREVTPADIAWDEATLERLNTKYSHVGLSGDIEFGPGDDGYCQSWRGNWGWWREFVDIE